MPEKITNQEKPALVLLFQRIVPSYRVPVFQQLQEELGIVVCHSRATINGNPSFYHAMDYPNVLLKGGFFWGRENLFSQAVFSLILKNRPAVVICEYAFGNLSFWKLLLMRPLFRYRLIGWTHGIKNRDMISRHHSFHYWASRYVTSRLDAVILYSEKRKATILARNKNLVGRLFVANNTLATANYIEDYHDCAGRGVAWLRNKLGLEDTFTICYIGRLLPSKRIDLLLNSWDILREKYPITLLIIGDGKESNRFSKYVGASGFHHVGAIHEIKESGEFLASSDVMVIPGAVGLAVIHSFAYSLPMIACRQNKDGPFHGPEIEYLKDGTNGFLCDSDPVDIAAHIERLILDPELLMTMKENALKTVREEASIDRMVDGFRQAIAYVLRDGKIEGWKDGKTGMS